MSDNTEKKKLNLLQILMMIIAFPVMKTAAILSANFSEFLQHSD